MNKIISITRFNDVEVIQTIDVIGQTEIMTITKIHKGRMFTDCFDRLRLAFDKLGNAFKNAGAKMSDLAQVKNEPN